MGRQRPDQFSEDWTGFALSGVSKRRGYLSSRWPGGTWPASHSSALKGRSVFAL